MGRIMFMKKGDKHLPPILTTLGDNSWDIIKAVSDAGLAANYWSVGDTKSITINGTVGKTTFSNLIIDAFILGFDHNAGVEGDNKIHFGLGKIDGVDVALCGSEYNSTTSDSGAFTMTTNNVNTGGWKSSNMRTTVLGSDSTPTAPTTNTLLAALPADLRVVMKSIVKYTDNTGGGSDTASYVTALEEYLPLLSEYEVFGTRTNANSAELNYQKQYSYYSAGNSKIKYQHGSTTAAAGWWLRSLRVGDMYYFCYVNATGANKYASAYFSFGVAPIFAV